MKRSVKELMREARRNRSENPAKKPSLAKSTKPESAQVVQDEHPEERELFLRQKAGGQAYYCVLCGHSAAINSQDLWAAHALTKRHKERRMEYIALAAREAQKRMEEEAQEEMAREADKRDEGQEEDRNETAENEKEPGKGEDEMTDAMNVLPKGFFDDAAEEAKIRAEMMSEEDRKRREEEERREAEAKRVEQEKSEIQKNMLQNITEEEENEKEISTIARENEPTKAESENKKKAEELAGLAERLFKTLGEDKNEEGTKEKGVEGKSDGGDNSDDDDDDDDSDDLDFDWMSKGVCEKRKKRAMF